MIILFLLLLGFCLVVHEFFPEPFTSLPEDEWLEYHDFDGDDY